MVADWREAPELVSLKNRLAKLEAEGAKLAAGVDTLAKRAELASSQAEDLDGKALIGRASHGEVLASRGHADQARRDLLAARAAREDNAAEVERTKRALDELRPQVIAAAVADTKDAHRNAYAELDRCFLAAVQAREALEQLVATAGSHFGKLKPLTDGQHYAGVSITSGLPGDLSREGYNQWRRQAAAYLD